MVVGNGMIASIFNSYNDNEHIVIFASGVSNSKQSNKSDFEREVKLLTKTIENNLDKKIIYFSSCSIENTNLKDDFYHIHKKNIENIIKLRAKNFIIFRLSNVVGKVSNNTNTIISYLIQKTLSNEQFELWKGSVRNIIDIEDVFRIVDYILQQDLFSNELVNVANPYNMYVEDIAYEIQSFFNIEQTFRIKEKKEIFNIDITQIKPIIEKLGIDFRNNYFKNILLKYYK